MPAVGEDRSRRSLDSSRGGRQRDDGAAPQQPQEASQIVSREAAIVRGRPRADGRQSEQIGCRPSQCFGLLSPPSEETPSVLDSSLPVGDINQIRAAAFEFIERTTETTYTTKLILLVVDGSLGTRARICLVVNVVFVVAAMRLLCGPEDVEVFAHPSPPVGEPSLGRPTIGAA